MAFALHVDIVDPGDETIKVTHTFWGHTEKEARVNYTHHAEACEYFRAAIDDDRALEGLEEIPESELPEVEVEDEEDEEESGASG